MVGSISTEDHVVVPLSDSRFKTGGDAGLSSLWWVGVLNGVNALVFGETTLNPIRV